MSAIISLLRRSAVLVYTVTISVSTVLIFVIYYFQSQYVVNFPFWSWAVFAPITLGLIIGIVFGTIINQYFEIEKTHNLRRSLEKQEILNKILIKSKETNDLLELLNEVLLIITDTPIAKIKPEAGILIKGQDGRFRMVSHLNINEEQLKQCAGKGITEGQCLCGLAVQKNEIIYTDSVNSQHTISYKGMEDHGHYVLPITYKNDVLGILSFHLDKGHKYNAYEIEFLTSIADILALVINTYQSEEKDRDSQIVISSAKRIVGLANWQVVFPDRKAHWSDELYQLLGYDKDEVELNQEFLRKIIHPEDLRRYLKVLRKAEQGEAFEVEIRLIDKSGNTKYVINKCTPIRGIDGEINRLSGTIFNLTEMHEKQEVLVKQEAFIESIASDSPYAMFLIDIEENKILFSNRIFNKIVSPILLKELEQVGLVAFESFLHKDDLPLFREIHKQVLEAKEDFYRFIARIAYDGVNYRWVNQRFKPFKRSEDGRVTQVLMVGIDIEKQKEAEEETIALNKKLINQNKKLQKLNFELDRFIYSASHDMRAPLSSILGLINLYKRDTDFETKDIYIEHIESSVLKLEDFIREIVDFSRNKKTRLSPAKIDIVEFIKTIYQNLQYINPSNKITFEIIQEGVDQIVTDRERLAIVIRNILNNAIVFANTNIDSFIRCYIEETASDYVIRIVDNGIGIDESHLEKVFNMFHRASEISKGSGLGLYIAKETVALLGGKLSIQSERFRGTVLTITLPKEVPAEVLAG